MKAFRFASWIAALTFLASCKVSVGDGKFDGSFFDDKDAATHDAGKKQDAGKKKDAGAVDDEDSGATPTQRDAGGGKDAGVEIAPSALPAIFAKSVCGALDKCLGSIRLLEYLKGTPCEDLITKQQTDRDLHWIGDSISAGRVLFRPASLAACEAAIVAFGCDVQSRRLPQSCEDALEGQVALHGACSIDYDCTGNAYCDKGLATETCPGSCVPTQGEDLPCKASTECDDHLICRAGKCTALLKEADSCENDTCPPGLVCLGKPGSRKCQTLGAYSGKENDACDAYGPLCMPGLVCASESAQNTAGLCKKPVDKDAVCRRAVPNQCPSTQYCKVAQSGSVDRAQPGEDGVCADLPGDGGSCAVINCGPGAVCVDDTCHALKPAGGSCDDPAECYSASCESNVCTLALSCTL